MAPIAELRRHFKPVVLLLLIFMSFVLMVAQMRSPARVSSAERWTIAVFQPLFEAGAWSTGQLKDLIQTTVGTQVIQQENAALKGRNAELEIEKALLLEQMRKGDREKEVKNTLLPQLQTTRIYADVIEISPQGWSHSLMINVGRLDGVKPGMPALDYSGAVVGMVDNVTDRAAKIMLLSDPGYDIAAIVADNDSRIAGLVSGLGKNSVVRFRPKSPQKPIQEGMELISSGIEGSAYPKGLRIGKIQKIVTDKSGLAYAEVEPYAAFSSLEELIVLLTDTKTYRAPATQSYQAEAPDWTPPMPELRQQDLPFPGAGLLPWMKPVGSATPTPDPNTGSIDGEQLNFEMLDHLNDGSRSAGDSPGPAASGTPRP